MTKAQHLLDAVTNGNKTAADVADALDISEPYARTLLNNATDDGTLVREREGNAYAYSLGDGNGLVSQQTIAPDADDEPESSDEDDDTVRVVNPDNPDESAVISAEPAAPAPSHDGEDRMPVNRDYLGALDERVPGGVPEYVPHNGELEQILADFNLCEITGKLPHAIIGGPTGAGKTHLARYIAQDIGAPLFTLQMRYSMDEADLLGSPYITDSDSKWVDGTLTKALLASRERKVVLLIDEVNRARPEAKGVLYSALDDRCRVELDGPRGGEVIEGNEHNLIVMATMNQGAGHNVFETDAAESRRLGNRYDVDHLGVNYPDRETEIVADRSPVGHELAHLLVKASNDVRNAATDPTNANVKYGVPTASVLEWAQTAYAFDDAGIDNPVMTAAESTIVNRFYEHTDERREVRTMLRNYVDGAPVDADALRSWMDSDDVSAADAVKAA